MKKICYAIALSAFLMPIITTTSLGQNGDWISLFDGESLKDGLCIVDLQSIGLRREP